MALLLHGEQVLVALALAAVIAIISVPVLLYIWLWHSKVSESKLALGYFLFMATLCVVPFTGSLEPLSVFSLTTFLLAFILSLPWSAFAGFVLHEMFDTPGEPLGDRASAVVMLFCAGVNAVLLYFIARKMRRLIK